MTGEFIVYDEDYASTSAYGWYEVQKIAPSEWAVLEFYRDGSGDYRTFELSKARAVEVAKRIARASKTQAPHYVDHGVKYYNQEAY